MTSRSEAQMPVVYLICYISLFFVIWTLYAFYISPVVKVRYPLLYLTNVFKLLTWSLPVFVYLTRENVDVLTFLKLRRTKMIV
jgi:hypothetical protein